MTSIRDFIPLNKLGEGTFSTVYKVRRLSDNQVYALKKVRMNNLSTKEKQNALNEVRILASIQSQYITAYKEAFFDEKLNLLCIVMEFADGGDLHKLILEKKKKLQRISEDQIWKAANHILNGLKLLHSKGILHRDLKSANIFLHRQKYTLGDLNVSKVNGNTLAYTQTGTPYYASPQVWRDQPYGSKSDIWSFGCVLYEMATLSPPFLGKDMNQLNLNIQKNNYLQFPSNLSRQLIYLIKSCLQKNPNNRRSANELLNDKKLQHFFPQSSDFVPENSKELLKTIKLPSDIKSIHQNLPISKYQSNHQNLPITKYQSNHQKPSHYVSDRPGSGIKQIQYRNCSDIYKSPTSKKVEAIHSLGKDALIATPLTKAQKNDVNINYSERPYLSGNKKVQVEISNQSEVMSAYRKKRHNTSMPRTEKRSIINHNVNYKEVYPHERQFLQDLRKKLLKKSAMMKHNVKPSWWN